MNHYEGMDSPREHAVAGHPETEQGKAALAAHLAALGPLVEQMQTTPDALMVAVAHHLSNEHGVLDRG
jgi:hypothetical protein